VDAAQFGKIGLSWIPILRWMRSYDASTFRLDLVAGVSLAAFVIPQSLAYASLAQLPPITGLYCCLAAGMGYAIFGTCRQIAVGPTSAIAILIATSAAALGGGDPARAIAVASALALFAGVVCIAGRGLGLANAAYFISDPILTGFKAGAGLYIASTQLPKLFGIEGVSGNFFTRTWHVISALPSSHVPTLLMGLAAIALFIVLQRRLPGRPTTLVVVAASIIFMSLWGRLRPASRSSASWRPACRRSGFRTSTSPTSQRWCPPRSPAFCWLTARASRLRAASRKSTGMTSIPARSLPHSGPPTSPRV
jgi:MFS superfamily sulfate permease-like transporter